LPSERVWLVSPVYFDVESYTRLRANAAAALAGPRPLDVRFVAVDDTAGADPAIRSLESLADQVVITPPFSLGHQRALVFGLRRLSTRVEENDLVVTLDADGEDQPGSAPVAGAAAQEGASVARWRRRPNAAAGEPRSRSLPAIQDLLPLPDRHIDRSGNCAAYRAWLTHDVLFHPNFDLPPSSLRSASAERAARAARAREAVCGPVKMTYTKLIQHGLLC
jgi:hypothetical protein